MGESQIEALTELSASFHDSPFTVHDSLLLRLPSATAFPTSRPFCLERLHLVLLFGSEQRQDVCAQMCLDNRGLGFCRDQIRRGCADGAFVDRRCLDGGTPGVHRGTEPCLHLLSGLPPALRQLANLLALTVRQIELRQRQPQLTRPSGTADPATASTTGSSGTVSPLRERPTAREEAGNQHAGHQGTKSNHVNLHVSALLADVLLI